jgi:hypothetical protein
MGRSIGWYVNHLLQRLMDLIFIAGQYLFLSEEEGMQLNDPVPIMNHYIAE